MAVIASLTRAYAQAVYLDGTRKFSEIKAEYVEPVKKHAAATYTDVQIYGSLNKGYITQQEFDDTMAIKYPDGYDQLLEMMQEPIEPGTV